MKGDNWKKFDTDKEKVKRARKQLKIVKAHEDNPPPGYKYVYKDIPGGIRAKKRILIKIE